MRIEKKQHCYRVLVKSLLAAKYILKSVGEPQSGQDSGMLTRNRYIGGS